jgi:hypothetical protein
MRRPVQFPLAHPALPDAKEAPKVTLDWQDGSPKLERPLIKPGTQVSVATQIVGTTGADLTPQTFTWTFAKT